MELEDENIKFVAVNELRVGSYIVMNDGACVIISISVSKTGKHGSAKAHITAKNIFNDKKVEGIWSTSEMVKCPIVTKIQYILVDIDVDGNVILLNEYMEEISNLVTFENSDVCHKMKSIFEEEKSVIVTVTSALGHSKITDCTEDKQEK